MNTYVNLRYLAEIVKRMINVSGTICRENQNTYFDQYPFSKNCAVYDILLKKYGGAREVTDNKITCRMRLTCWIPPATKTFQYYVIRTLSCCFVWQLAGYCPNTEQYHILPNHKQLIIPNYSPDSVDVPLPLQLTHFKMSFNSTKVKETITVLLNRCWGIKCLIVQK